jgi:two-component system, cell cycle response regulator DivK
MAAGAVRTVTDLSRARVRRARIFANYGQILRGVPLAMETGVLPDSHVPVMLVEDDNHARSGYMEFLETAGFDVHGMGDAREALPAALRQPPGAVVTDITLPGMSGFELAAALRADVRTRNVPIIGLTAHWTPDVRSRAAEVGMRVVLLKPCTPSHLIAELERLVARHPAAPAV